MPTGQAFQPTKERDPLSSREDIVSIVGGFAESEYDSPLKVSFPHQTKSLDR